MKFEEKVYRDVLKKVSKTTPEDMGVEIISAQPTTKNGFVLKIKDTYGDFVLEFVNQSGEYSSAVILNGDYYNYDKDQVITEQILDKFGFAICFEPDLTVLMDLFYNCYDWTISPDSSLEDEVANFASQEIGLNTVEVKYLFKKFDKLSPKEREDADLRFFLNLMGA